MGRHLLVERHRADPQLLAGTPIEALQRPLLAVRIDHGSQQHPVAEDDGAAVAGAGQRRLPAQFLLAGPDGWRALARRDAVAAGAANTRPILGWNPSDEQQQQLQLRGDGIHHRR